MSNGKMKQNALEIAFKKFCATYNVPATPEHLYGTEFEGFYRNTVGGNARTLINTQLTNKTLVVIGQSVKFVV